AGAVARSPDGVAPRVRAAVADPRRGDAAAARRGGGDGLRPSADQGEETALLRGREFHPPRAAAAGAVGRALCRCAAAATGRLERTRTAGRAGPRACAGRRGWRRRRRGWFA